MVSYMPFMPSRVTLVVALSFVLGVTGDQSVFRRLRSSLYLFFSFLNNVNEFLLVG